MKNRCKTHSVSKIFCTFAVCYGFGTDFAVIYYRFIRKIQIHNNINMSFNSFLKSIFGNKSERDLKKLMPIVRKIQAVYPEVEQLSNDELRERSAADASAAAAPDGAAGAPDRKARRTDLRAGPGLPGRPAPGGGRWSR